MMELTQKEKNYLVLAALETIRMYQYEPINIQIKKVGSLDGTSQLLYSPFFDPGYLYVIQNICALVTGTGKPQTKIGIYDGATYFFYESATPAAAEDSVEYVGQLLVGEHRRIFAEFEGATTTDTVELNINGYRIKT